MFKCIITFLSCYVLFFSLSTAVAAEEDLPMYDVSDGYIYIDDFANVLSTETKQTIEDLSKKLDDATTTQFVVLTVKDLQGYEAAQFGTQLIRKWGIGDKESNNGVLFFASFGQGEGNRTIQISVGQGLEGALPDGKLGRYLDEYALPNLQAGQFDADRAFLDTYKMIYNDIAKEYEWDGTVTEPEKSSDQDISWVEIIIIIIVLIFLISGMFGGNGGGGTGRRTARKYRRSVYTGGGFGDGFGGFGGGGSAGGGAGRSF